MELASEEQAELEHAMKGTSEKIPSEEGTVTAGLVWGIRQGSWGSGR